MATGIVYLVGAGPGDPGLLTRRAAELLARADVVAYDRLVHPDVVALAPQAELIDVGKKPGQSAEGQARINDVLIEHARAGKTVVRLKGGDPFVFGRGGEEAELLVSSGVPFEIVPGVTSAIAGPAYAGIPLTHRDHASWAAIATGHEDPTKESSALDWEALARAPTSVFLMGMERLAEITSSLIRAGREADTPAAVVSWATWPKQRVLQKGRDARVFADVRIAAVGSATANSLRACGLVPDLVPDTFTSDALADAMGRPRDFMSGRAVSVLVPRAEGAPDDFVTKLEANGWKVRAVTAYRTQTDDASVAAGRSALDEGVDAVLFTSGSTVRSFVELWGKPSGVIVCAMGPRTSAVCDELGVKVDAVAAEQSLEGLVAALVTAVGR